MSEQSHRQFLEWLRAEFAARRVKARPMESFAHKGVLTDNAGNLVTMQELQAEYEARQSKTRQ